MVWHSGELESESFSEPVNQSISQSVSQQVSQAESLSLPWQSDSFGGLMMHSVDA